MTNPTFNIILKNFFWENCNTLTYSNKRQFQKSQTKSHLDLRVPSGIHISTFMNILIRLMRHYYDEM